MLNVFYLNSALWLGILLLYSFGWSDLCIPLGGGTIAFVLVMIAVSLALGVVLRKRFTFYILTEYKHKYHYTLGFIAFFVIDFLYARTIPLFAVLSGNSMYEKTFDGLPFLHWVVSGMAILYTFYLFYLFLCFKKWTLLLEGGACCLFFLLLFQRQNLAVIAAGMMWLAVAYLFTLKLPRKKRVWMIVGTCAVLLVAVLVGLYAFGLMGNARYGQWDATDSSMIMEVGKINDRFPSFIPKEYTWAYVYITSPLANLQHNVNIGTQEGATFSDFIVEFFPYYVTKWFGTSSIQLSVLSEALIVCTAFASVTRCMGIGGAYLLFFYEAGLVLAVIFVVRRYRHLFVPVIIGCGYFALLNFFDNSVVYPTSSLMIAVPLAVAALTPLVNLGYTKWKMHRAKAVACGTQELPPTSMEYVSDNEQTGQDAELPSETDASTEEK